MINFQEFMKEALKNYPAKIEATVNEQMDAKVSFKGRAIELVPLSIDIVLEIIDKVPHTSIDEYCYLLKRASQEKARLKDIPKEQMDVEKEIMNKILESVFKK